MSKSVIRAEPCDDATHARKALTLAPAKRNLLRHACCSYNQHFLFPHCAALYKCMASRGPAMQDRDVAYEIDRNIADLTMVSAVLQCSLVSGSWAR